MLVGAMIGEKKTTHGKIPLTLTVEESSEVETSSDGSIFSLTDKKWSGDQTHTPGIPLDF